MPSADLWLNFTPTHIKDQPQHNTQDFERFDFAILENPPQKQTSTDGHTISTKPNTPPLYGQILTDKAIAQAFKHFCCQVLPKMFLSKMVCKALNLSMTPKHF